MSSNILYKVMLNESLKIYKKPIPNPCAAGPIPAGGTRYFLKTRIQNETFENCSILFKFKEGEDFNHMNILNI